MKIAIITAMAEETLPIFKKFGNVVAQDTIAGVLIRQIEFGLDTIYLATSGVGEIKAALAVQLLKNLFEVEAVVNFGFVGALNKNLEIGEIMIADKVCHYQFDISKINGTKVGQYGDKVDEFFYLDENLITSILSAVGKPMRRVAVASGDKFVSSFDDKKTLSHDFGCDICEMELAGLSIACERNNLPLASIKVVSDKADEQANVSFESVLKTGLDKAADILPKVICAISGGARPLPPIKK